MSHNFVTIVSGLPRSGTSLMMQMLAAGGLQVLTDGRRPNPMLYVSEKRLLAPFALVVPFNRRSRREQRDNH